MAWVTPELPGARVKDHDWRMHPTPDHHAKAGRLLDEAGFQGHDIVALAPGSKMQAKKWPEDRFEHVGLTLLHRFPDLRLVVVGGPGEIPLGDRLCRAWGDRAVNLSGALSVWESAALLERCTLYVGNDTGTMHLAASVATPCVAIFSARDNPGKWEPAGRGHIVLRHEVPCAGCMLDTCVDLRSRLPEGHLRRRGSHRDHRAAATQNDSMLDPTLVRIGQLIGKPPGWERVVRALAPPTRFANSGVRTSRQPDGYVFPVDRGTLIGWSIHFFGAYEPEVRTEIRRHLEPGAIAIDVGANVGWHTLLMAARTGSTGRVYAFEPNDSTRRRLVSAVEANHFTQVTVDGRAVADRVGASGFQAPLAGHVWDGTGRLTAGPAQGRPEGREGREGLTTETECTTLDAFVAERHIDRLAFPEDRRRRMGAVRTSRGTPRADHPSSRSGF